MAKKIEAETEVNAKKETFQKKKALELAKASSDILVAKGKKVVRLNMKKDEPSEAELLKLMLGPTGNLRAPTLKVGKKLIVGFNEEVYGEVFGG